jgi:hypothetical protein
MNSENVIGIDEHFLVSCSFGETISTHMILQRVLDARNYTLEIWERFRQRTRPLAEFPEEWVLVAAFWFTNASHTHGRAPGPARPEIVARRAS